VWWSLATRPANLLAGEKRPCFANSDGVSPTLRATTASSANRLAETDALRCVRIVRERDRDGNRSSSLSVIDRHCTTASCHRVQKLGRGTCRALYRGVPPKAITSRVANQRVR
jgi:hypothetical protein